MRQADFTSDWTSVELNDELIIRYTKRGNSLPLTTFALESGPPCMDSGAQLAEAVFSLELNGVSECTEEPVTK